MANLKSWVIPKSHSKPIKRKGRGCGTGLGKTAGKGHKGQKARSGGGPRIGFEGGQMPIYRRLPKFGFNRAVREIIQVVNVSQFNQLPSGISEITPEVLKKHRLVRRADQRIKVLGNGDVKRSFKVACHFFSKGAAQKITGQGGSMELITSL